MLNLDWRLKLFIGIGMLIGSIIEFYWGYQLKIASEPFSHIWVLALGFAWIGSDQIQKAIEKKSKDS